MNYHILAKKWRPQTFNDVIGQQYIVSAISNSLLLGRIHHAWLFFGIRGTGKTTIARILAKSLNCKLGISPNPCRKCSNCVEVEQGNFIDLYEVDAASRTKVEDMKELLDNIRYLPSKGRFKIYLIDEVHMLSRYSFNFLLKNIEEPPQHIKFILATTNLEKIPDTILSRCLQFQLKPINLNEIVACISNILHKENITYEIKALSLISQKSEGSLRDAITLTEQMISMGKGNITEKIVRKTLGMLYEDQILYILTTLLNKDLKNLVLCFKYISDTHINFENILVEILQLLHQISIIKIIPSIKLNDTKYSKNMQHAIQKIAELSNYNDIYLYYQTALLGKKELHIAPDQKISIEMTLLRMFNLNTKPIYIK
ncbi:DNA polymerase III subunit gamma [Buchnera aphidicola str. Bp (Baizongia pistaciae)]|uniref:DNA polymerase III subunit gamma n=1 Tax=Buchnera aphidicola subsp. Baizongia pistaciae (strain Bp) TaxID=224915 RepID=DPO3X_BUCBP|nr:DNA polymerase III subunit gamma/tau [Buchnera aphidicola]Q89A95.1 RecName: Full=DNA polymerase III subunit gamma [Buchnera aphidicola str. Bp (Baizongia pistaciae)]AAO27135.1 DNA polymerase III subunit gamma [Buchnera aphidicola str. Bp (Baizongia pistaciae)]